MLTKTSVKNKQTGTYYLVIAYRQSGEKKKEKKQPRPSLNNPSPCVSVRPASLRHANAKASLKALILPATVS